MRIMICGVPAPGHIMPLLPIARAFLDRGDEVTIASGENAKEMALSSGLSFRAVGPKYESWFEALRVRTRGNPGDGLAPERIEGYFVPRLFGEIGMALVLDDLLALGRELEPELLVFEPYFFAAPLIAALIGARPLLHLIGPVMDRTVLELTADAISPMWREFGLQSPPDAGVYAGTMLNICPPSLDPATSAMGGVRPMRPAALPIVSTSPLPVSFAESSRPLVYLTLGTFSNNNLDLFTLVLSALKDEPINLIVSVGADNDPSALSPVPENARVVRYIPQAELLPHCSGVIHHGGAGTMFGVLAHGLASLVLPQSADNFKNADLLEAAGAAKVLLPGEVTKDSVRAGLAGVLDSSAISSRAKLLAQEIADMPSPNDVAAMLAADSVGQQIACDS